jgi:hydrogenase-4 component B
MLVLAACAVAVGLSPGFGLNLIRSTVALIPLHTHFDELTRLLTPMVWASRALAACLLVAVVVRGLQARTARRAATWACGYTAVSPRMQYTGSSFSEQFARIFESFLPALRREQVPSELFPQHPGRVQTHHPDPVERRMFEVLGQGEDFVVQASTKIPEQPRFAFAAGLIALLLVGALLLGSGQPW